MGFLLRWRKALRLHQWVKNGLIFAPLLAAHEERISWRLEHALWAFFAFCLAASGVYLLNDLQDIAADRAHPQKRFRPIASGAINRSTAGFVAALAFILAALIGLKIGAGFLGYFLAYLVLTFAYTYRIKQIAILDLLALTLFYVLRIMAGASASHTTLSFWLLAFSIFLFLSLALVKRYSELRAGKNLGKELAANRGYYQEDAPILLILGVAAGYASLIIFSLYLNTDTLIQLYSSPKLLWALVPVFTYWINYLWLTAHRGQMHHDPIVFAITNRASQFTGLAFVLVLALASTSIAK
jgi:4-hydroxybenzoate polyprenyltransferase